MNANFSLVCSISIRFVVGPVNQQHSFILQSNDQYINKLGPREPKINYRFGAIPIYRVFIFTRLIHWPGILRVKVVLHSFEKKKESMENMLLELGGGKMSVKNKAQSSVRNRERETDHNSINWNLYDINLYIYISIWMWTKFYANVNIS